MHTRGLSLAAGAAVAALLAGCTLGNVDAGYSAQGKSDTGLVVMSVGRTGAVDFEMDAIVRPVGGGSSKTIVVDDSITPKDFGKVVIPPANANASGWGYAPADAPLERLVVVQMAAGDYDISSVSGKAPRFKGSSASPFIISSDRMDLRFTVRPGQVTYLGSVVFGFPDWLATSHPNGPLQVTVRDTHDRDAKLLRERYPNLGADLPASSLALAANAPAYKYYLFITPDGGDSRGI
jgi:hypothetical protein